jgi:hypothetical protein
MAIVMRNMPGTLGIDEVSFINADRFNFTMFKIFLASSPTHSVSIIWDLLVISFTYDHSTLKTRLPVRSALFKQRTGGLVVRWVTTSEYPLLYVFAHA